MADNRTANLDPRGRAEAALATMTGADFPNEAERLLNAIGYASDRRLPDQTGDPADFLASVPATQPKDALIAAADSIRLLFQVTDAEIAASAPQVRPGEFDSGVARSFLFIAAELRGDSYSRGDYAAFTREINKRFNIPAVVLFWTAAKRLTIAFVHRRPNKRDPNRDVIGSVSLIREINPLDGNRVWIDIVAALSLDARLRWMESRKEPRNFDGLLAAWLDDLGAQELNKQFYSELFAWFELACRQAKFPATGLKTLRPEEHVIRLITRLLFIWFIKEKSLVAPELFVEGQVTPLLKDYDRDSGDSYYRAVLQNLFFATLSAEIRDAENNPRRFSKRTRNDHRNFSLWRYEEEIANPGRLQELFNKTPFINGGLFDCLDSEESTHGGGWRLDCFTDDVNQRKDYSIPNRLFFGRDGLIPIFEKYKFTLRENTPIEQDVALDPELLGKVFEKLLGAYNPETRENVRKQTGSFYTPREVVDYMVDEALAAALAENANPDDGDRQYFGERIAYLLDYADACNDARDIFTPAERRDLVRAIADIRVLDPAVGSGAFPMAILHKLTLALRRLDPNNAEWEELQKELALRRAAVAFDTPRQEERDAELKEISAVFEQYRDSDYGRKLYLVQNAIFGVDRQPVACQIAKLRFFISLAIEQESSGNPENNYGIRPLPNLETRIVAANTLLRVANLQEYLTSPAVEDLLRQLQSVRERHFHASARQAKLALRREDKRLRVLLREELENLGMQGSYASRISEWDPYDQNAYADWFDAKYTFSLEDGFDVTIGNPPYVRSETSDKLPDYREMRGQIVSGGQYQTLYEKWDLYIPFIEQSYNLLNPGGFTTLIVSDAYCHARYGKKSREFFLRNGRVLRMDFLGKIQIFEAGVRNVTYLVQKANGADNEPQRRVHNKRFGDVALLPTDAQRNLTERAFFPEDVAAPDFRAPTLPLSDICYVTYGLRPSSRPGAPDAFVTADLTTARYDDIHCKPFVEGKHLDRWLPRTNLYLEWGTDRAPHQFYAPTFPEMYEVQEKILVPRSPGANPKATYDNQNLLFTPSSVGFIRWNDLSGVRNGSINKAARYRSEGYSAGLPHREGLEENSKNFAIKFLVAVMNSAALRIHLIANRRSNIHLYPDDWKKLPIPDVAPEQQEPITALVDKILDAKAADANADTSAEERAIDRLVYALYGLADDEIAAVESSAAAP